MNDLLQTADELRRMSSAELAQVGEDSLRQHICEQARLARDRHGAPGPGNLETFLGDRTFLRHPVRLVLEFGEMGLHQFAQVEPDYREAVQGGRILYLRPALGRRPDLLALAVSYMIPVLNYGAVANDDHCLAYGAALLGLEEDEYYRRICDLAEFVGAEERYRDPGSVEDPARGPAVAGCDGAPPLGCSVANPRAQSTPSNAHTPLI